MTEAYVLDGFAELRAISGRFGGQDAGPITADLKNAARTLNPGLLFRYHVNGAVGMKVDSGDGMERGIPGQLVINRKCSRLSPFEASAVAVGSP